MLGLDAKQDTWEPLEKSINENYVAVEKKKKVEKFRKLFAKKKENKEEE